MTASMMWNISTNMQILELETIPTAKEVKRRIKTIIKHKKGGSDQNPRRRRAKQSLSREEADGDSTSIAHHSLEHIV